MLDLALKISAVDYASSVFANIAANAQQMANAVASAQSANSMAQAQQRQAQYAQSTAQQAAAVGESMLKMGTVGGLAGRPMVKAFTELEDTATRLQSIMMDKTGKVSSNFKELDAQARDLGNRLPGMTADFYELASAMLGLGMSQDQLLKGGFKSAAYLGVLTRGFGEDYKQAGTAVAKFKESLGVSDGDMIKFMDTVQRLRHMGMPLTDMRYAFARLGGEMKSLGLQGLQAANDIAPLAAYIYKTGASGQITGSSLNQLMRQLAMMPLIESKKAFLTQAEPILQNYGIKLKFVDDQGQFLGIQNMLTQMDKLKKLTALERSLVINAMVGGGGDANAMKFMINMGTTGYDKMKAQLADQADLETRVQSVLKTQTNTWDALEGTIKNTLAVLGGGMAPALKSVMNYLNGIAAGLGNWLQEHPRFVQALATGGFALTSFLVVAGGTSFALGKAIPFLTKFGGQLASIGSYALSAGRSVLSLASSYNNMLGITGKVQGIGLSVANSAPAAAMRGGASTIMQGVMRIPTAGVTSGLSTITSGFGALTRGVGMMNLALVTSPAFWVVSALAIGAILIIQNWDLVKAFFRGLGQGLKAAFAEPWKAIQGLGAAFAPIMPMLTGVFRAIMSIFAPTQATAGQLQKAASWGVIAGQWIGTAMRVVATPLIWVLTLVGMLFSFIVKTATGGNLLGRVMVSAFTLMVSPILMVWNLIKAFFKGVFALFDGKTWQEAGKTAVESLWTGMLEIFGKILDGVKGVADKVMGLFGMGKKDDAAKTAEQSAKTAETATSTPKPPPTPPPAPPQPITPPPAPDQIANAQPRRLVVKPQSSMKWKTNNQLGQLYEVANSPAMNPVDISALQSEQIASSIVDMPQVSYQQNAPKRMAKAARPATMNGWYSSGQTLAPSVPHVVDGVEYMSTQIDLGTNKNPNPPHRKKAAPKASAAPAAPASIETQEAKPSGSSQVNAPFTFNFSFNFAGGAMEGIGKEIQKAIDDKLPEIERAVRESINSTRLGFSL